MEKLKILLQGAGALAAMFALTTGPAIAQETGEGTETSATEEELTDATIVLRVDGMSCPFCAHGLEERLREIRTIDGLLIRVSAGLVQIRIRKGEELTDEALHEVVERAGFSLRAIRRRNA